MGKRERYSPEYKVEAIKGIEAGRKKGLTTQEASKMYGISYAAYFDWKNRYERDGISGLEDRRDKCTNTVVDKPQVLVNKVKEIKSRYPGYGNEKISGHLARWHFMKVCAETVRKILGKEEPPASDASCSADIIGAGETKPKRHYRIRNKRSYRKNKPPRIKHFERAKPNELWQMDIMTFMLKGQYRIYLIGVLDDNSRFMVNHGLFRRQTDDNVIDVFRGAIEKFGCPKEVLTDNGRQFYSWRGKSKFTKTCIKLGINHIRSRPYHPQTLGKIESFWRNLYQEFLSETPLSDFEEAQSKITDWIKYYNYKRVHLGIGKLVPADRFFSVREQVEKVIQEGTAQTEKQMQDNPVQVNLPTYLVGKIGEKEIRILAKDGEIVMNDCPPAKAGRDCSPLSRDCEKPVFGDCPMVDSYENNIAKSGAVEPLGTPETCATGQICAKNSEENSDGCENTGKCEQSGSPAGDTIESTATNTATINAPETGGQIPPGDKRHGEEGTDIESSARQDNCTGCLSGTEHQQRSILPVDKEGFESAGRIPDERGPREETVEKSCGRTGTGETAEGKPGPDKTKPETAGQSEYSRQNNGMGPQGQE